MIVLDTDHLNVLQIQQRAQYAALTAKMTASVDQDFVTAAVTREEQMRGWLALLNRSNDPHKQVAAYAKLNDMVDFFGRRKRLPFDDEAARSPMETAIRWARAPSSQSLPSPAALPVLDAFFCMPPAAWPTLQCRRHTRSRS